MTTNISLPGLDALARALGSDKRHNCLQVYDKAFAPLRGKRLEVVELCSDDRSDLELWKQYFTNASLTCVFADKNKAALARDGGHVIVGAHGDENTIRQLAGLRPHIVIDNGNRDWAEQIKVFSLVFPLLSAGGIYVVENMQTCFGEEQRLLHGAGTERSFYEFIIGVVSQFVTGADLANCADKSMKYLVSALGSVQFVPHGCLITKADPLEETILAVVAQKQIDPSAKTADNGGSYSRNHFTKIVDAPAHIHAEILRQQEQESITPPSCAIGAYANATVYDPCLVEVDGKLVAESCANSAWLDSFGPFYRIGFSCLALRPGFLKPQTTLSGTHILLRTQHDVNYGHWLIESLPLLKEARALYPEAGIIAPGNKAMRHIYASALSFYDVDLTRVHYMEEEVLEVENLVHVSPITKTPWVLAQKSIDELRSLVGEAQRRAPDFRRSSKIYVSRNDWFSRRIVNEAEIIPILQERGFEIVIPEKMTLLEQMVAFSDATCVVGNLGAGLTNIAFAPQGVKLLALATEFMHDDFYWDLMAHKQGPYFCLHGKATKPEMGMYSDFEIDIAKFVGLLDETEQFA